MPKGFSKTVRSASLASNNRAFVETAASMNFDHQWGQEPSRTFLDASTTIRSG